VNKRILKILSGIGLAFLIAIIFIFGQIPLVEGKHFFKPYIDTQFAKDYSPEKFELIKIGMTEDSVINIIGQPLYKGNGYKDELNTNFHYTGDGKLLSSTKDDGQNGYDDYAWYRSSVEFNSENIVVSTNKGWSYD
jgi:outer membrane protein assembly factor BamE (lipoprotein component of BamABCDE complex)